VKTTTALLVLCCLITTSTCLASDIHLRLNDRVFKVTTAISQEERAKGLMFVKSMPNDEGMLFYYNQPHKVSFWMKNTYIALDIIFFDQQGTLLGFHSNAQPCKNITQSCPRYPSDDPVSYVLEINAGLAKEMALKKGDVFTIIKE